MALSEAYGGNPDYTILTLEQFRQDLERMGHNDKLIFENKANIDDTISLADLIATIKSMPSVEENDPSKNIVVSLSKSV